MNNRHITAMVAILCAPMAVSAPIMAQPATETKAREDVSITITSDADTLRPGGTGSLLVRFTPAKGYHVNAVPPMSITFDSTAAAVLVDTLSIPQDTATGYLDTRSAVRQPFTMKKTAASGTSGISGTLTYYYCSDAEGWCRREKKPFTVPMTVK